MDKFKPWSSILTASVGLAFTAVVSAAAFFLLFLGPLIMLAAGTIIFGLMILALVLGWRQRQMWQGKAGIALAILLPFVYGSLFLTNAMFLTCAIEDTGANCDIFYERPTTDDFSFLTPQTTYDDVVAKIGPGNAIEPPDRVMYWFEGGVEYWLTFSPGTLNGQLTRIEIRQDGTTKLDVTLDG